MAARDTRSVLASDLVRLRDDWERQAAAATAAARAASSAKQPGLAAQARIQSACAADLNDLIEGRKHPSARRS